jgi:hypothetical protein
VPCSVIGTALGLTACDTVRICGQPSGGSNFSAEPRTICRTASLAPNACRLKSATKPSCANLLCCKYRD